MIAEPGASHKSRAIVSAGIPEIKKALPVYAGKAF